jgi:hypothetical protein
VLRFGKGDLLSHPWYLEVFAWVFTASVISYGPKGDWFWLSALITYQQTNRLISALNHKKKRKGVCFRVRTDLAPWGGDAFVVVCSGR